VAFAFALVGTLLVVAGSSPGAKRALFGPRRSGAASGTVDQV